MVKPLNICIGYDSREPASYHVLCHSIMRHASGPVSFTPIVQKHLRRRDIYNREADTGASTEFTLTRFLTPYLAGFTDWSIFMDCDMLMCADVYELRDMAQTDKAVMVCKHDYQPTATTKFLGHVQYPYPRKNWSSLMLFNNDKCKMLKPDLINEALPRQLHRFEWLMDEEIGSIPLEWNYLVGEGGQSTEVPKNIHWTNGGPWFSEYKDAEYAQLWHEEVQRMVIPGCLQAKVLEA
jgi:hypothetical protein